MESGDFFMPKNDDIKINIKLFANDINIRIFAPWQLSVTHFLIIKEERRFD